MLVRDSEGCRLNVEQRARITTFPDLCDATERGESVPRHYRSTSDVSIGRLVSAWHKSCLKVRKNRAPKQSGRAIAFKRYSIDFASLELDCREQLSVESE